jgi:hypothetical protein
MRTCVRLGMIVFKNRLQPLDHLTAHVQVSAARLMIGCGALEGHELRASS